MSGRLSGFQKGGQQFMEEIINNSSLFPLSLVVVD